MDESFIKLLLEIHKSLPQEGPGSKASTIKALSFIKDSLPSRPKIIDIGCGPGRQTITLAKNIAGEIMAIDIFDQYLEQLKVKTKELALENKITTQNCPMEKLPFDKASFDLIWSEGSAYLMGFENALKYWKEFLKPVGYMAATEVVWLKNNQPNELKQFWTEGYPAIKTIEENMGLIEKSGYQVLGHFTLPADDWWDYYKPLQKRIEILKKDGAPELLEYILSEEMEIEMFEKYSEYYSYEFFIMRKT